MAIGSGKCYESRSIKPLPLSPPSYYKESHKVLGQTFGCLVLQDYEAVTPNLLARTIETVEGGGIVILLLKTMNSLKQLYSMSMVGGKAWRGVGLATV